MEIDLIRYRAENMLVKEQNIKVKEKKKLPANTNRRFLYWSNFSRLSIFPRNIIIMKMKIYKWEKSKLPTHPQSTYTYILLCFPLLPHEKQFQNFPPNPTFTHFLSDFLTSPFSPNLTNLSPFLPISSSTSEVSQNYHIFSVFLLTKQPQESFLNCSTPSLPTHPNSTLNFHTQFSLHTQSSWSLRWNSQPHPSRPQTSQTESFLFRSLSFLHDPLLRMPSRALTTRSFPRNPFTFPPLRISRYQRKPRSVEQSVRPTKPTALGRWRSTLSSRAINLGSRPLRGSKLVYISRRGGLWM